MKRFLLYPLLGLIGAIALLLAWALYTESGMRQLTQRVLPMLPVELTVGHVEGRLAGPLTLHEVHLSLEALDVEVERLHLDWLPWRLARREARVRALELDAPRVTVHARDEPPEPADGPGFDWEAFELPLAIRVDTLRIRDGSAALAGEPLVGDLSLDLSARAQGRELDIRAVDLASDRGAVNGHARVSTARNRSWDVDLRWSTTLPDLGELSGRTRAQGRLRELTLRQQVQGLVDAQLTAELTGLPAPPAWDVELEVQPLRDDVRLWPPLLAGTAVELTSSGDIEDATVQGTVRVPELVAGTSRLELRGGWVAGTAQLNRLRVDLADGGWLQGEGRLRPEDNLEAEVALSGADLGWPLTGEPQQVRLPSLQVDIAGDADDYGLRLRGRVAAPDLPEADVEVDAAWRDPELLVQRLRVHAEDDSVDVSGRAAARLTDAGVEYDFELDGDVRQPELPPLALALTGRGDQAHVNLSRLEAEALEGRVHGGGTLAWAEGARMDFALQLEDINPGVQLPDWPGRVSAAVQLQGGFDGEPQLSVDVSDLRGRLRGRDLAGGVRAELQGREVDIADARVSIGRSSARVRGRASETALALDFELDSPDLNDLHPDVRGRLSLSGQAGGSPDTPELALELDGEDLGFGQFLLESVGVHADVDLGERRRSELGVTLAGLRGEDGALLDSLELALDGLREDHRLTLAAARDDARLELAMAGALDEDFGWAGELGQLRAELAGQQMWTLESPARVAASAAAATVSTACLDGLLGRLCLEGQWADGEGWQGELALAQLELAGLTEWLGVGILARGAVAGRVVVSADAEGFHTLAGGLGLTSGSLYLAERPEENMLEWQRSAIALSGDRDAAQAIVNVDLGADGAIHGRFRAGWNDADPALDGRLEAELAQLNLIAEYVPDLSALRGRMGAALEVNGTASDPQLRGEIYWEDGAAQLPVAGLSPQDIELRAEIVPGELNYTLTARSGDGRLESDGTFALPPHTFGGTARLRGEDLLVADLPEARVFASPDLTMEYRGNRLDITGEVRIPRALISGVVQAGAVSASPDEVIVGEDAVETEALDLRYDVRVRVGPDVSLEVAGLRGRVDGDLRARQGADGVGIGNGEVRVVDGTFGAFGQRLTIEQGRLIWAGVPLDSPALDIRAVRRVDQITAGAAVRGTLAEPEIDIFSDPPLPRAEALSYLTVGKSINDLDAGEQDAVNSAANSLALAGGNLLAREIGGRLGLDEVAVTGADNGDAAELVVGKYLGPRLFVSYGVGIFEAVNTLRVRYRLSSRWTLEAASGEVSSADLIYTIERE